MSSPTLQWGEAAVCPLFTPPRFRDPFTEETRALLFCPQLRPCRLWPPFLWTSASSSRKVAGCQAVVRSPHGPSSDSGTERHMGGRPGKV